MDPFLTSTIMLVISHTSFILSQNVNTARSGVDMKSNPKQTSNIKKKLTNYIRPVSWWVQGNNSHR